MHARHLLGAYSYTQEPRRCRLEMTESEKGNSTRLEPMAMSCLKARPGQDVSIEYTPTRLHTLVLPVLESM